MTGLLLLHHPPAMSGAQHAWGSKPVVIDGVFRRRTDLGDELPRPKMLVVKESKEHAIFQRIRCGKTGEDPAKVGRLGLEGSMEFQRSLRARDVQPLSQANERAVLVQVAAHLEKLREYAATVDPPLRKPLPENMGPGSCGENLFLDGGSDFHAGTVCIGDEFDIVRGHGEGQPEVVCRLQVSSPRQPCSNCDLTFGQTFTPKGVRAQFARSGMGGFFCRVLVEGTLHDGDVVRLAKRPNPKWSLERVSSLLYGNDVALMK